MRRTAAGTGACRADTEAAHRADTEAAHRADTEAEIKAETGRQILKTQYGFLFNLRLTIQLLSSLLAALQAPLSALHAPVPAAVRHGATERRSGGVVEWRSSRTTEQ